MKFKALLPISLLSLILLPGQAQNNPGGAAPATPPVMSPENEAALRERLREALATNNPAPQIQPAPNNPANVPAPLTPRPVPLRNPPTTAPQTPGAPATPAAPGAVPVVPAAPTAPAAPGAVPAAPGTVPVQGLTPPTAPPGMGPQTAPATPPAFPTTTPPVARPVQQPVRTPAANANALGNDIVSARAIQFNNAPIDQIFATYSHLTGRTVLRPTALPQVTITIEVASDLTREEAIQALDSVLALNQVSMIPRGDKFVIAQATATAHLEGSELSQRTADEIAESDKFITQVVQLQTIRPSEVAPLFATFTKNPAGIVPIDGSQIIVLRDSASNVRRMLEILERVDVEPEVEYRLEVIPIKYGKVGDLFETMNTLVTGTGGGGGGGVAGGIATPRTTGRTPTGRAGTGGYGTQTRTMQPQQMGGINPATGMPGATPGAPGQTTFQQRLQQIVSRAATTGGELQLLENARIVPDERSNSLLIYANRRDMAMITNIVGRIDVLLAQVVIEAIVLEISLGDDKAFGITATQNRTTAGDFTGAGSLINPGITGLRWLDPNVLTDAGAFTVTNGAPGGFSYFAKFGSKWDIALNMIASDTRANVIQKPRIQTSHAVPGAFFIGKMVPYASALSSYPGYGVGGGVYSQASVQQIEVGTSLQVTPFITPDGLVVMEIIQDISSLDGYVDVAQGTRVPQTSSKVASATLSIQDGDTIMLGGFINDEDRENKSGVPFLKDIPLLGNLFRSKSRENRRSEMIILLHVNVLKSPTDAGMHAALERANLPGVRDAEMRIDDINEKRQERIDREQRRRLERQVDR
jgi:general secretion pathway protein D